MLADLHRSTLMPTIRQRVQPDFLVYGDAYHSSSTLNVSKFRHDVQVDKKQCEAKVRAHMKSARN